MNACVQCHCVVRCGGTIVNSYTYNKCKKHNTATDHSVLILDFLQKQVISFCTSCDMTPLLFQKSIIFMTYSTKQTDCLKQNKSERERKAIHFPIQDKGVVMVVF